VKTEESRRIVLEFLAAQGKGDADAIRRLASEDLRWEPPGSVLPPVEGREAVLEAMARAGAESFDLATLEVDVHKIVAEGDTVAIIQSMRCKTLKGRDYSNLYCWVYTCADGKLVRMQEFADSQRFNDIVKS
jgi:ketosteroid isomerase-like protein